MGDHQQFVNEPDYGSSGGYQSVDATYNQKDRQTFADKDFGDSRPVDSDRPRDLIDVHCAQLDRKLLVPKLFYFFFYSSFGSLFPLIAVYFKQEGMNGTQAGFLIGIRPFVEYCSAPIWAKISVRLNKGKWLLLGSLFAWIVFTVPLSLTQPSAPYCVKPSLNSTTPFELEYARGHEGNENIPVASKQTEITERDREKVPPGIAPLHISETNAENFLELAQQQTLVRPPFSYRVFRKSAVEEVFFLTFLLVVLGEFFSAPAINLADVCTMEALDDHPELYSKQRMLGSVGWGLSMFFVGIALDGSNTFSDYPCSNRSWMEKNYSLCFAVFSVFMCCAWITATQFTYPEKEFVQPGALQPQQEVTQRIMDSQLDSVDPALAEKARSRAPEPRDTSGNWLLSTLKTFSSPPHAAFLFVAWWNGVGTGFVFAFLFWHLQDLGGTPSLFGLASIVNHVSEIVAYFISFRIINHFGHTKVLYIGLLASILRFLYISILDKPYWVLPFEFVQGISHAVVWASASSYISLVAPATHKANAQSLLQGLQHGLGRGCGAMIGGIITTYAGSGFVFRLYGTLSLVVLLGYIGINRFYKTDGIKYQADNLLEDSSALAPHGIPMNVPYSASNENMSQGYNQGYGTAPDPTQDAYDKYVHEPFEKPVRFEALPDNLR